jgi:hypothetical protein
LHPSLEYENLKSEFAETYKLQGKMLLIMTLHLGLRQQIKSSYIAESTIKNSTHDHQRPLVCVKPNPARRFKDPIRLRSHIRKVCKISSKIGNTPQPSTSPTTGYWATKTTEADRPVDLI